MIALALSALLCAAPPDPSAVTPHEEVAPSLDIPPAATEAPKRSKKDKKGETEPDEPKRFELSVGGMLQVRYDYDTDSAGHHVSMPRARFIVKGGLDKLVELNLGVDVGDYGAKFVNAFMNIRAYKSHLQVRAGRMKRPFLRERLVSISDQLLVDRSLLSGAFGDKRDYGVMLHNGLDGKRGLEWAAGVFGDYDAEDFLADTGSPEFNPVVALRLGYYMKDLNAYDDADRDGGGFRIGGAASTLIVADRAAPKGRETGYRLEADVLMRMAGATVQGGFLARSEDTAEARPSRLGGFVAADYFFCDQFDAALRWSTTKPDGGELDHEIGLGLSAWLFEDHLKITADGAFLRGTAKDGQDDYRVRLQLQLK